MASRARVASNVGEFIGIVGSNNPGPLVRFSGCEPSRAVRRGIAPVFDDDLRGALAAGLLAGESGTTNFLAVRSGVILAAAFAAVVARGCGNNRGER